MRSLPGGYGAPNRALSQRTSVIAEVTNLTGNIPYVEVLPEDREMKTEQSARKLPFVGCALMAHKDHPSGFPRYLDKNDTLSDFPTLNYATRSASPEAARRAVR